MVVATLLNIWNLLTKYTLSFLRCSHALLLVNALHCYVVFTSEFGPSHLQLGEHESEWVSYPYFKGLISLLNDMELMKRIYLSATDRSKEKEITMGKPTSVSSQWY